VVRDVRRENSDRLISAIEEDKAPWRRDFDGDASPRLQINAVTGNAYVGMNQIMLRLDGRGEDPRWCTQEQARKQGWQVKQGSEGRPVETFAFDKGENGEDIPKRLHYTVFHASQIEGIPEYQAEKDPEKREKALASSSAILDELKASGMKVEHDQTDRAFYRAATDTVHLPPRDKFQSPDSYYATMLHEAAKWTGHKDRMNREYGRLGDIREDFRADLTGCQLTAKLGLPAAHEFLQGKESRQGKLVELLKEDKNELPRAARDAEKITNMILSHDRVQEQTQREEPQQEREEIVRSEREIGEKRTVERGALDEAEREASYLSSLERSHDRTHVAGQHIDPNSPEAAMFDAADTIKADISAAKGELNAQAPQSVAGANPATERSHAEHVKQSVTDTKIQAGKAAQISGKNPQTANLNADSDALNRGDVYEGTRDKIAQDKEKVIEDARKERKESEEAQIKDANAEEREGKRPYKGIIVALGEYHLAQRISRDVIILHTAESMAEMPKMGSKVAIRYENGKGKVSSLEHEKTRDNSQSLSIA
jgi:antirestriction protein ArdC